MLIHRKSYPTTSTFNVFTYVSVNVGKMGYTNCITLNSKYVYGF